MLKKHALVCCLTALLLGNAEAGAQTCAVAIEKAVAGEVAEIRKQHDVAGMVVAVVADGKQWVYPFGVSAKDSGKPATGDTIFEVGSVSKVFTSILVGYAQAQGKLDLTGPSSRYWPELKGSSFDRVSVLELATYTPGGLPLQFPDAMSSEKDLVGYFRGWKPEYAAGTKRQYSNPSIGLAGYLGARSLGRPFVEVMEREVLPKLGLTDTHIRVPESRMVDYAWGYNGEGKAVRVTPGALDAEAYGVKTTAKDMASFLERAMAPATIGDAKMRAAVEAGRRGYLAVGGMTQGLGWEMYPWPVSLEGLLEGNSPKVIFEANAAKALRPAREVSDGVWHNKTGSTNGFGTYVAMVPGKKMGLVMLANKNYPIPARVRAGYRILKEVEACKKGSERAFSSRNRRAVPSEW